MNAPDPSNVKWKKSSKSSGNGQCLEWVDLGQSVAVRDSKNPTGPALVFSADAWRAIVEEVKSGKLVP